MSATESSSKQKSDSIRVARFYPLALGICLAACSPPGEGYRSQPIPEGQITFVSPGDPHSGASGKGATTQDEDASAGGTKSNRSAEPSEDGNVASPSPVQTMILTLTGSALPEPSLPTTPEASDARPTQTDSPYSFSSSAPLTSTPKHTDPKDQIFQRELSKSEAELTAALQKLQLRIELANKGEAKTPRQIQAAQEREQSISRHQDAIADEIIPAHTNEKQRIQNLSSPTISAAAKATEQKRALENMALLIKRVGEIESSLAQDIARININLIMDEQVRNNGID